MSAQNRPVSFCLIDGRPVFMDIEGDSYFRLAQDEERGFLTALNTSQLGCEPIVQGFAWRKVDKWRIEAGSCPCPPRSALPTKHRPDNSSVAEILSVARLLLIVRRALRTGSIADILGRLPARTSVPSAASMDVLAAATRFRNARRLVPMRGNCLSNSLTLIQWLAERGLGATLVFGVKLDPFAAHCWVQSSDVLLNDHPDRVERFTPLRTFECTPATP